MFKLSANMVNGLLAGILASLATSAAAQEMPKQFEFSVTYHAVVTSDMVTLAEKDFAGSFHGKFIATNDSGGVFMHNMFGNCSYAVVRAKGVLEMSGGCTYTDKDGDQLYETFKIPPGGSGEIAFVGGTGKFAGIECAGKFETVARSQDRSMAIGKKNGSCKRP